MEGEKRLDYQTQKSYMESKKTDRSGYLKLMVSMDNSSQNALNRMRLYLIEENIILWKEEKHMGSNAPPIEIWVK